MHMKLLDYQYLKSGTERQQLAFGALERLRVFSVLKSYSPVVTGAIPLDVEVEGSELEVICSAENLESFADEIKNVYGSLPGFGLDHAIFDAQPAVLVRFQGPEGFAIKIQAQASSVFRQVAVLLLLVEARLLAFAPKEARERIRTLKRSGMTTEAAFADCFGLEGESTAALLKIAQTTDRDILHVAHRFLFRPH